MNKPEQKIVTDTESKKPRKRKKTPRPSYEDRKRFVIDRSRIPKVHALALKILTAANKKEQGREVNFEHLAALALAKVRPNDIERLKNESLTDMDKVNLKLIEYNRNNKTNLSLGQFLARELGINPKPQEEKQ